MSTDKLCGCISQQILIDPVKIQQESKFIYEFDTLLNIYHTKPTSPFTRNSFSLSDITRCHKLRNIIYRQVVQDISKALVNEDILYACAMNNERIEKKLFFILEKENIHMDIKLLHYMQCLLKDALLIFTGKIRTYSLSFIKILHKDIQNHQMQIQKGGYFEIKNIVKLDDNFFNLLKCCYRDQSIYIGSQLICLKDTWKMVCFKEDPHFSNTRSSKVGFPVVCIQWRDELYSQVRIHIEKNNIFIATVQYCPFLSSSSYTVNEVEL